MTNPLLTQSRSRTSRWLVPGLVAVALGAVLGATHAPYWVLYVALVPLVVFGCWWRFGP